MGLIEQYEPWGIRGYIDMSARWKGRVVVTFEHKQLIERVVRLGECPENEDEFKVWLAASRHVDMLRRNAREQEELIVTALYRTSSSTTIVHSAVVKGDHPGLRDHEGLLKWSCNPFHQSAATVDTVMQGGDVRFDPAEHDWGTDSLVGGFPLVYGRTWEGMDEPERQYLEIAQTYAHQLKIHWRSQRSAHCRFDRRGNWEDVVSITEKTPDEDVTLVSFQRDSLDRYLVEHNSVLVQLFDFTLFRPGSSSNWRGSRFVHHDMDRGIVFYQRRAKDQAFARGAQIVRPRLSRSDVEQRIENGGRLHLGADEPVKFTVLDLRHGRVATVTTDPATTTDYFSASENSLPFELSPAFFRAAVLSKYKADSEKYTVYEGRISCRGGWGLRSYSINEAGQVTAYICDLRHLPYEEQLHWHLHNEPPKTGLSDRSIATDFLAQWPETMTPREMLVDTLQRWCDLDIKWWKWRSHHPPNRLVVVPRTESRDEWGQALVALSNSVIEGFVVKELRQILNTEGPKAPQEWKSIVLLENILRARGVLGEGSKLVALRELNAGRNLSGVHARGSKAKGFVEAAQQKYGTYAKHFEHLCEDLSKELMLVEKELA